MPPTRQTPASASTTPRPLPPELDELVRELAAQWSPARNTRWHDTEALIRTAYERAGVAEADQALTDWAHEAGWSTGHGDTLTDMIREMRAQWQQSRAGVGELVEAAEIAIRELQALRESAVWKSKIEASFSGVFADAAGARVHAAEDALRTALARFRKGGE